MRAHVILLSILAGFSSLFAQQPGSLDPTFGNGGKVTDWSGGATDVAIQPDGKIVVAGPVNGWFGVARYNADGSTDTTFGGGTGKVTYDIGNCQSSSLAIQLDGKIVALVALYDYWYDIPYFALVRLDSDGSRDTSFDLDGIVGADFAGYVVAIQPDGKIVVGGGSHGLKLARYNPNGSLDTNFGTGGIVTTDESGLFRASSIVLQSDGKIVAGSSAGNGEHGGLVRYNSNGSLDAGFGNNGIVITPVSSEGDGFTGVTIQADRRIVTASHTAVVRYMADGSLDNSFGAGGIVIHAASVDALSSIAVQSDGKIVATGWSVCCNDPTSDFVFVRYNPSGSADSSFGDGDGITTVDFNNSSDSAHGMALDGQGRAVVVGQAREGNAQFALARFLLETENTITVTNTNDSGPGSLRQAIADANPGDTIYFNVTGTITLTSGRLIINKNLTISGPGASLLSISGNNASRVFDHASEASTLNGMTIRNGSDGGISTWGQLTVSNSVITQNGGSGISGGGSIIVSNSTISGNAHTGINSNAGCYFTAYLSVSNSTISGNGGNGIISYDGVAEIANSTIVGNRGGIFSTDDCRAITTRLWNTIVAGNSFFNSGYPDASGTDILGKGITVASHNLIGDATHSGGVQNGENGNIVGVNPLLGPLQDNGGPTMTHALLAGSHAINAGGSCVLTENGCGFTHPALTTDQRGMPRNGTVDIGAFERQVGETPSKTLFDFDGDGKADVAVYRPEDGNWYVYGSRDGFMAATWGLPTDKLVPADYDGDGKTDFAIFRDGIFWILNSSTGTPTGVAWGLPTDTPVPADYDGDGKADPAIFRDGVWAILGSKDGYMGLSWGLPTDIPVPADYDGDGKADVAIFRDGIWAMYGSTQGYMGVAWGLPNDVPVPADYDGDGKTDVGIFREGIWAMYGSKQGYMGLAWGLPTDTPVPADYDGDGKADPAIYREGIWAIYGSALGYFGTTWGAASDAAVQRR